MLVRRFEGSDRISRLGRDGSGSREVILFLPSQSSSRDVSVERFSSSLGICKHVSIRLAP